MVPILPLGSNCRSDNLRRTYPIGPSLPMRRVATGIAISLVPRPPDTRRDSCNYDTLPRYLPKKEANHDYNNNIQPVPRPLLLRTFIVPPTNPTNDYLISTHSIRISVQIDGQHPPTDGDRILFQGGADDRIQVGDIYCHCLEEWQPKG